MWYFILRCSIIYEIVDNLNITQEYKIEKEKKEKSSPEVKFRLSREINILVSFDDATVCNIDDLVLN